MKMGVVTTRLPNTKIKLLEAIAKKEFCDKSTILRKLALKSLNDYLYENYISKYKKGDITIYELAKTLDLDLWTITDYLKENNIEQDITYEEIRENQKNFEKLCDSFKKIKYNSKKNTNKDKCIKKTK